MNKWTCMNAWIWRQNYPVPLLQKKSLFVSYIWNLIEPNWNWSGNPKAMIQWFWVTSSSSSQSSENLLKVGDGTDERTSIRTPHHQQNTSNGNTIISKNILGNSRGYPASPLEIHPCKRLRCVFFSMGKPHGQLAQHQEIFQRSGCINQQMLQKSINKKTGNKKTNNTLLQVAKLTYSPKKPTWTQKSA